ncbi:MAG: DHH family phosphoesterase [TACK group archaeon]|nr:DHH family phosphoesterase [TACK group archaeon]
MEVGSFATALEGALPGKKVAVFSHPRVDPDGFASAYAMVFVAKKLGAFRVYAYLDDMNSLAKRMNTALNPELPPEDFVPEVAIVTDTCGLKYSHRGREFSGNEVFVIDHHECGKPELATAFVDAKSSSSCELVLDLMDVLGVRPDPVLATALLGGILFDTGVFKYATPHSIKAAAKLIDLGADYGTALSFSKREQSKSLRMARLKAAQRLNIAELGDIILATSTVDIFEGEVAEALLSLGADVAFVAAPRGNGVRVSGRADEKALSYGVNLASFFGESGGGHEGAAGALMSGDAQSVLSKIAHDFLAQYAYISSHRNDLKMSS